MIIKSSISRRNMDSLKTILLMLYTMISLEMIWGQEKSGIYFMKQINFYKFILRSLPTGNATALEQANYGFLSDLLSNVRII